MDTIRAIHTVQNLSPTELGLAIGEVRSDIGSLSERQSREVAERIEDICCDRTMCELLHISYTAIDDAGLLKAGLCAYYEVAR